MRGLLIKDFKLMKNQKNFFVILLIICVGLSATQGGETFIIGFMTFVGSLFTISTISYDEFDNGNAFLFTLPFDRADYVKEKYGFGFITGLIACLAGTVISGAVGWIKNDGMGTQDVLSYGMIFVTFMIVDLFLLSFLLPFQLKFGAERGRIAMMITFGVIFLAVLFLGQILQMLNIDYDAMLGRLTGADTAVIFIIALVAGLICLAISFTISRRIVEHKEF